MSKRRRLSLFLALLSVAAAWVITCGVVKPALLEDLRNLAFDSYQRVAPRAYDPETPARVVGVDEESLKKLGQWPWPRTRLAELVQKLDDLGAAAIAFDFVFSEPDRASYENFAAEIADDHLRKRLSQLFSGAPGNDEIFAAALERAPSVLGMTLAAKGAAATPLQKAGFAFAGDDPALFAPAFAAVVAPLPLLEQAARGIGATNWLPDRDQIVRRIPLVDQSAGALVPALVLEALRVAQGETTFVIRSSNASGESAFGRQTGINAVKVGAFEILTGPRGEVRPRFAPSKAMRVISALDVLQERVDRKEVDGRIVFVGALAAGLGDVRATPLEASVPGVLIHAQIVEAISANALLERPDWALGLEFVIAFAALACVTALLILAPPSVAALVAIGSAVGFFAASFALYDRKGLLFDPAFPSLTILGGYLIGASLLWRAEEAAKRNIRRAFGKYLAPAVVDRLAENPDRLVLGGETRELTLMFSDLRNFSGIAEGLNPTDLTQFMNDYLTAMTDAILESEGTVDKYIGDSIVAFWNAPLDVPEHPRKAVAAALRMRAALLDFNAARAGRARQAEKPLEPAAIGIGINLGPCTVGNMGSARRFDYSVLGDAANLASRLEGVCKLFGVDILVSAPVKEAASEFAWLYLGAIVVKGRSVATYVYAVAGDADFAATAKFKEWRSLHEEMMSCYAQGRLIEAARRSSQLQFAVAPAWRELYVKLERRFSEAAATAQAEDWSPVWALDQK